MHALAIAVGQIYRDNYQPGENPRFVKVLAAPSAPTEDAKAPVTIVRCAEDGTDIAKSPKRTTAAARFRGKKDGFSLHRNPDGSVYTPPPPPTPAPEQQAPTPAQ